MLDRATRHRQWAALVLALLSLPLFFDPSKSFGYALCSYVALAGLVYYAEQRVRIER